MRHDGTVQMSRRDLCSSKPWRWNVPWTSKRIVGGFDRSWSCNNYGTSPLLIGVYIYIILFIIYKWTVFHNYTELPEGRQLDPSRSLEMSNWNLMQPFQGLAIGVKHWKAVRATHHQLYHWVVALDHLRSDLWWFVAWIPDPARVNPAMVWVDRALKNHMEFPKLSLADDLFASSQVGGDSFFVI